MSLMNGCCESVNGTSKLYVISFTVGEEAGLAMVAASNERQAFEVLQHSGNRNSEMYSLVQIRDIGMSSQCHYGLLMESYVNALEAFAAIVKVAETMKGPKGDDGKDGKDGSDGPPGPAGKDGKDAEVTETNIIAALGYIPQEELVSGESIKTINNESILGSGNITVGGGGTVTVDSALSTTSENPVQNKVITTELNKKYEMPSGGIPASDIEGGAIPTISTSVVNDRTSDTKTSSPKSVYSEIHPARSSSIPQGGMLPNVFYNLGTLTGSNTFTLATPVDSAVLNHYYWTFDTSSTAPTITWPSGISWMGGSSPTLSASKHYEVSVINNVGVYFEV